jgi:hypothetical protein
MRISIAGADQRWHLIAPIAAVAEPTMQQDYRRSRVVRTLMFHIAPIASDPQRRGAVLFEILKFVVGRIHANRKAAGLAKRLLASSPIRSWLSPSAKMLR